MRARDRADFPKAPRDSIYGCRSCGNYACLKAGDKLACPRCRTATPLVDVVDETPSTAAADAPRTGAPAD